MLLKCLKQKKSPFPIQTTAIPAKTSLTNTVVSCPGWLTKKTKKTCMPLCPVLDTLLYLIWSENRMCALSVIFRVETKQTLTMHRHFWSSQNSLKNETKQKYFTLWNTNFILFSYRLFTASENILRWKEKNIDMIAAYSQCHMKFTLGCATFVKRDFGFKLTKVRVLSSLSPHRKQKWLKAHKISMIYQLHNT